MWFMPKVKTIEEAKKVYKNLYFNNNLQKKSYVIEKWNNLYLPKLEEIIKNKNADQLLEAIISSDFPPSGKSQTKIIKALTNFSVNFFTIMQLKKAHDSLGRSDVKNYIKHIWYKNSFLEIERANNFEELKNISNYICSEGETIDALISKWLNFCFSVKEIKKIKDFYHNKNFYDSDIFLKIETKKDFILFLEIPKAQDIETIKDYYFLASSRSATKILAFEKWLELCTTIEEADEAYVNAPKDKNMCIINAYKKVKSFFKEDIRERL